MMAKLAKYKNKYTKVPPLKTTGQEASQLHICLSVETTTQRDTMMSRLLQRTFSLWEEILLSVTKSSNKKCKYNSKEVCAKD